MSDFFEAVADFFVEFVLEGIVAFFENRGRRRKKKVETSRLLGEEETQERIGSDDSDRDKET